MLRSRSGEPASPPRSFPATRSPPPQNRSPTANNSRRSYQRKPTTQTPSRRVVSPGSPKAARDHRPPAGAHKSGEPFAPFRKHLCRSKLSAQASACKPPLTSATQPLKTFARNRYRQPFTPKRLPQTPSPKTNRSTFPHQGLYTRIMSLNFSNQSPMSRNRFGVTSADFTCPAKPPKLLETR